MSELAELLLLIVSVLFGFRATDSAVATVASTSVLVRSVIDGDTIVIT